MKKLILILCLVMVSCGVRKNATKSTSRIVDLTENATAKEEASNENSTREETMIAEVVKIDSTDVEITVTKNTTVATTVYDTSKPVDPNTGRSPVLSDIVEQSEEKGVMRDNSKSAETASRQSEVAESKSTETTLSERDDSKINISENTTEEVKEKKGVPGYLLVCLGVVLTLVALLVVWIYKKRAL